MSDEMNSLILGSSLICLLSRVASGLDIPSGNVSQSTTEGELLPPILAMIAIIALAPDDPSMDSFFRQAAIVPDVIRAAPKKLLSVEFDSGEAACLGNLLASIQTRTEPRYNWTSESKNYFTLIMVDPDAPSHILPFFGQILHQMVVNIPSVERFYEGQSIFRYGAPAPPGTAHRYLFLVYEQPPHLSVSPQLPIRFNVQKFAEKHKLGHGSTAQASFGNFIRVHRSLNRRQTACHTKVQ